MLDISAELIARVPTMLWDWEVEKVCIIVGSVPSGHLAVVSDLWAAQNLHHDPYDNFALTRPQWDGFKRKAANLGVQVLGIGHSHPFTALDGPSPKDISLAGQRIANFVYHSKSSKLHWYTKRGVFLVQTAPMPAHLSVFNKLA